MAGEGLCLFAGDGSRAGYVGGVLSVGFGCNGAAYRCAWVGSIGACDLCTRGLGVGICMLRASTPRRLRKADLLTENSGLSLTTTVFISFSMSSPHPSSISTGSVISLVSRVPISSSTTESP